ncbi:ethanolamine ammonia-lyase subunit EutC [Spirosoma utsteinense]|uniref:Ethanolamine ammonia-lyase small subunit n=1 Tax=Spirosoma utsteinense TaxID=2585773 RepID=A0ABR6W1Z0_9BACT|nr:ethanolamine ammonia-lyase subunit EutC [Spirosoma utsteinense]MBC3785154.1 ethanolamine ammonia-lyase small subunit [Spirosoma utsteinense]MBC3790621.1 ethanolamine ammonia-lyase small subunit [Spirosoma utsteinense]
MHDDDPWAFLKTHTPARIAQGRTGRSLPTSALLSFQLDHARARDAVHSTLDTALLLNQLNEVHPSPVPINSEAVDRQLYLKRPDLGRKLSEASHTTLQQLAYHSRFDLCIVVADGLSALAINRYALPVVTGLVEQATTLNWSVAPLCLVEQGRVAIGDEIAHSLKADLVVVLIGERPGLSSPDSMGAYLTYRPRPGLTDESRNCVSNIRPNGLSHAFAIQKITYLLTEMKRRQLSGVLLKDDMPTYTLPHTSSPVVTVQSPETPD